MKKVVSVLISTYNGENHLEKQIESVLNQSYTNIKIIVRDDGSKDGTISLLEKYEKNNLLTLVKGKNIGPMRSFLELIKIAPKSDFFAFCDQDDIWLPDKIKKSVDSLLKVDLNKPSLYFSKSTSVDNEFNELPKKGNDYYKYADVLSLALVRNICQGCTCVFNDVLANYINKYEANNVYMHDWWIYLVCLSLKGNIVADSNSYMYYRQHENNVIGSNPSILFRMNRRIKMIFTKRNNVRVTLCHELLNGYSKEIDDDLKQILDKVIAYKKSPANLIKLIFEKSFYSSSNEYNLSFILSVITFVF